MSSTFHPSTQEARVTQVTPAFEASLDFLESSRTVGATLSQNKTKQSNQNWMKECSNRQCSMSAPVQMKSPS